eukprot:Sspe_Gene.37709::Locus_18203_Transcript_1_1_Confidence_1.000_Length_3941::g.37709::m.37709
MAHPTPVLPQLLAVLVLPLIALAGPMDPVNRMLEGLSFPVPTIKKMGIVIDKGDVGGLSLEDLDMTQDGNVVGVNASGVSFTFAAQYYSAITPRIVKGDITIASTVNARIGVRVEKNLETPFAYCHVDVGDVTVHATGALGLAKKKIAEVVKKEVPVMACEPSLLPLKLSALLKDASAVLANYSKVPVDPWAIARVKEAPLAGEKGLFNFNQSTSVDFIRRIVSDIFGKRNATTGLSALGEIFTRRELWTRPDGSPMYPSQPPSFPIAANLSVSRPLVTSPLLNITLLGVAVNETDTIGPIDLRPVSKYSMMAAMGFSRLNATLQLKVDMENVARNFSLSNVVTAQAELHDVLLNTSLLMGVDADRFARIAVGDIDYLSTFPPMFMVCMFYPMRAFNLSTFDIAVGKVEVTEHGLISPNVDSVIDTALSAALMALGGPLRSALPSIVQQTVVPLADRMIDTYIGPLLNNTFFNPCAEPPPLPATAAPVVNFTNSTFISTVDWLVDGWVGATGDASINRILEEVKPVTFSGEWGMTLPGVGTFNFSLERAALHGVQTFDAFDVLVPTNATTMRNHIGMGSPSVATSVSLFFSGKDQQPFAGYGEVELTVADIDLAVSVLAEVDRMGWHNITLGNLTRGGCLLHMLNKLRFPEVVGRVRQLAVAMNFTPIVGIPLMPELAHAISTPQATEQFTRWTNYVLNKTQYLLNTDQVASLLDKAVAEAQCSEDTAVHPVLSSGSSTESGPLTETMVLQVLYGVCGALFLILAVRVAVSLRAFHAEIAEMREAEEDDEEDPVLQSDLTAEDVPLSEHGSSLKRSLLLQRMKGSSIYPLYLHPGVPRRVRVLVPVALFAVIAGFLTANLTLGTRVHAHIVMAGSPIEVRDVFSFTLASTIKEMWNSGVYPLALLVALFSGSWPYVKLTLLLFSWFSPPALLTQPSRGKLLRALDLLGKWSLIDGFLMSMMMVAFRLHLANPDSWEFMPSAFVTADLIVRPEVGLYAFNTAAILSLAINHAMTIFHRNAMEYDEGHRHSWFDVGREKTERRILAVSCFGGARTGMVKALLVTLLLVVALGLLVSGVVVDTFNFEFKGATALALQLEHGDESANKRAYSVVSLARAIWVQSTNSPVSRLGYGYLVTTFLMFAAAVPLLQVVALAVLWACPLTLHMQKVLFFANEVIAAWNALDVFVVALIASLLEISQFAGFMIGGKCDGINQVLSAAGPVIGLDVNKCFDVRATLLNGCWILFAAALVGHVAYQVAWKAADKAIRRLESEVPCSPVESRPVSELP